MDFHPCLVYHFKQLPLTLNAFFAPGTGWQQKETMNTKIIEI